MKIITRWIVHPSEEGVQILLISSLKNWNQQELMELFDIDKILELCKNEWEKDRIKDFPISVGEIWLNTVVSLWDKWIAWYELISWIQNRLYLIVYKTDHTTQFQEFLKESVCIITLYDDDKLLFGNIKQLKNIFSDFVQTNF